jgi:ArsR family transcriptional regulator
MHKLNTEVLEEKARDLAAVLRVLANEQRLLMACKLVECGEASVGMLADAVGLSSSALSQHLGKMRARGLVTFRRDGQTLWYRISDGRVEKLLSALDRLFSERRERAKLRSRGD